MSMEQATPEEKEIAYAQAIDFFMYMEEFASGPTKKRIHHVLSNKYAQHVRQLLERGKACKCSTTEVSQ